LTELSYALAWILLAIVGGSVGRLIEHTAPYRARIGAALESAYRGIPNADVMLFIGILIGEIDELGRKS